MIINSQETKQSRVTKAELVRGLLRHFFTSASPWAASLILMLGSVGCVRGNAGADRTVEQEFQGYSQFDAEEIIEFKRIEDFCILFLTSHQGVQGITVTTEKVGDTNVDICKVEVDVGNVYLPDGRRVIVHTSFTGQDLPDPDSYIVLMKSTGVQIAAVTNDGKAHTANWIAIEKQDPKQSQ